MEKDESAAYTGQLLTKVGTVSYTTVLGIDCVQFANKNSYIQTSMTAGGENALNVSVSLWIYLPEDARADCSDYPRFFNMGNSRNAYSFFCGTSTPDLHLNFQSNDSANNWPASNVSIEKNRWYHICGVLENGRDIRCYLNGVKGPEEQHMDAAVHSADPINVYINYFPSDLGIDKVCISRLAVYNRVLSEEEIQMLAGELTPVLPPIPEDNLVMYLPLQNGTAATTGQTAAATGDISFTEQQGIACMRLDGNSYLGISPLGSEFQFSTNSQWTISFKVCFDRTSGSDLEGLLCSAEPNTNGTFFIYHYLNGWSSSVSNSLGVGVNGSNEYTTSSGIFTAGVWNTVTIVRNGSSLKIVVNGARYTGGSSSNVTNASKLYIPGGSPKLQGYMTAFRLYSRVLTDDEIRALENEFTTT